jgi:hypothetical protein
VSLSNVVRLSLMALRLDFLIRSEDDSAHCLRRMYILSVHSSRKGLVGQDAQPTHLSALGPAPCTSNALQLRDEVRQTRNTLFDVLFATGIGHPDVGVSTESGAGNNSNFGVLKQS